MKNKIHSLIVEGIVFCGSGLVLLPGFFLWDNLGVLTKSDLLKIA